MTIFRSENRGAGRKPKRALRWMMASLVIFGLAVGSLVVRARSFDRGLQPTLSASAAVPVGLMDGRQTTLGHLTQTGRPTVISLWASWCAPCRREAPDLAELQRRARGKINFVYLNVRDQSAKPDELGEIMAEAGLPPNTYARMNDDQIARLTGASDVLIPRTLIYDRSGMPLARITGLKPLALARVAGLAGL